MARASLPGSADRRRGPPSRARAARRHPDAAVSRKSQATIGTRTFASSAATPTPVTRRARAPRHPWSCLRGRRPVVAKTPPGGRARRRAPAGGAFPPFELESSRRRPAAQLSDGRRRALLRPARSSGPPAIGAPASARHRRLPPTARRAPVRRAPVARARSLHPSLCGGEGQGLGATLEPVHDPRQSIRPCSDGTVNETNETDARCLTPSAEVRSRFPSPLRARVDTLRRAFLLRDPSSFFLGTLVVVPIVQRGQDHNAVP